VIHLSRTLPDQITRRTRIVRACDSENQSCQTACSSEYKRTTITATPQGAQPLRSRCDILSRVPSGRCEHGHMRNKHQERFLDRDVRTVQEGTRLDSTEDLVRHKQFARTHGRGDAKETQTRDANGSSTLDSVQQKAPELVPPLVAPWFATAPLFVLGSARKGTRYCLAGG
jgi:hypothetical protein